MINDKLSSQKIILSIVVLVVLGLLAYFVMSKKSSPVVVTPTASPTVDPMPTFAPTPTVIITPTPSPVIDISDWQEYNSNLTTTILFKNLKAPFLFKYPKDWNLDEGIGGIYIYSSDDHVGYELGTVPAGKFMINIVPDIKDKNNEEIKSWCKNNLQDEPITEFLSEKYIEVDNNKSYSIDYKLRSGNFDSIRQICTGKPDLKVVIYAEPLSSDYFDRIISTFKFIK